MRFAPRPEHEEIRLRALYHYDILDTLPEPVFDDFAFLASQICATPVALISLVDENRQWSKARFGLAIKEMPRSISLCAHAILQADVLLVADAARDERFHDNPMVIGEPFVRFYAGAPLQSPEGHRIGALCVMDYQPRQLKPEQIQGLQTLARQVMQLLELRRKSESSRRAMALMKHFPAAIFCTDYQTGEGRFVEWNAGSAQLWTLPKQDVLGRTVSDVFAPEYAAAFLKSDREALQSGCQVVSRQESIATPQGRKEIRTWKVPLRDATGRPQLVLGASFDITQQVESEKQLQAALLNAEARERTMDMALEGASVGVWDWNLTNDHVDFDRRWCDMLGLDHERMVMELKTWEERVHPDDLAQAYRDIHAYMNGETHCYENIHRLKHANGEWVYILDRGGFSAWDLRGRPTRFTGTHLDITAHEKRKLELHEARKRLEEAETTGRFGSWRLNLVTGEAIWSRGHNLIFDFDEEHAPSFQAFLSCLDPLEHEKIRGLYKDLLLGKISQFETNYRVLTKSGQERYVKAHGHVQYDARHLPVWIIGTVQDITSLKLMEKSLIESREEAIAATKTKSRFLANMSHEIRTPLNGIVGNTVLLMDTELSEQQLEMAQTTKRSSEDLLTLIDDILDFSKVEAGKLDVELQSFELRAVVSEAVKTISNRAKEKAIALEVHVDEKVPAIIISDHFRLRQVLLNLLSNAVKFTEVGKIRVEVSHSLVSDSIAHILVSVADTGIGMSAGQQEKLFKDFTQADESTTRKYGGTGLGLAICKQLCTLLGGSIEVQSELGRGSKFSFRIVATVGQELAPVATRKTPKVEAILPFKGQPLRILVAEDNEVNQAIVLQFLKKLNLSADIVGHGQAAVEAVKREGYDIVLMDVHMPIMDGYDATRQIRAETSLSRQPYVVALTADAMKEDRNLCLDAGMNDFLKKPLDLTALANSISKFLGSSSGLDSEPEISRMASVPSMSSHLNREIPRLTHPSA